MDLADKPAGIRTGVRARARGGRRRAGDQADRKVRRDAKTGTHRSPVESALRRTHHLRREGWAW